MGDKLLTIGEMARRSGVPVKTIRHYSDFGVLPPSAFSDAGYRMYSEADRSRLEMIRTFRAAGFGLPTIKRLFSREVRPSEAVELQLEAVNLQLRTLERQRALLRATREKGEGAALRYPDRARALAVLTARERRAFLEEHFERGLEGIPVDPETKEWFRRMMVEDLPEDLTDEQLASWVELSELASDDGFIRKLREQTGPFWEAAGGRLDRAEFGRATNETFREAAEAVREGHPPTGERGQRVVQGLIDANARALNRAGDPDFEGWLLRHYDETSDPRMERYWHLISTLKDIEYDPSLAEAHRWLVEGLRWRVSQTAPRAK
ncbi:MerR family transcriptional regulator [Rubrobacter tropicus]|uniref:MerR family transcriptional regulator n=1 Tax=Rubrobacter tropicus TaxID=2653851 RepID=A0A6G8Q478_9ACTN|nr:MerR family transcriptional regulator [Rubrobacter tropicus]QIN81253.1 MerR family transcriptional regulator [Rubrobacter tropicus]